MITWLFTYNFLARICSTGQLLCIGYYPLAYINSRVLLVEPFPSTDVRVESNAWPVEGNEGPESCCVLVFVCQTDGLLGPHTHSGTPSKGCYKPRSGYTAVESGDANARLTVLTLPGCNAGAVSCS